METETISKEVSKEAYKSLIRDSMFLDCLINAGVDNWVWYGVACEEYHKLIEEEEAK